MSQEQLKEVVSVGLSLTIAIFVVAVALAVVVPLSIGSAFKRLSHSIAEGRTMRVSFSLDELSRKAVIDAVVADPAFWNTLVVMVGNHIKGEKGDRGEAADPQEEVMRIFDHQQATATLINGVVTRANHQLSEQVREIISREVLEPTEQLKQEIGLVQFELIGLRSEIDEARQLFGQAQTLYDKTTEVTAEMAAAARKMEQIVAANDILRRLFGLDQPFQPTPSP